MWSQTSNFLFKIWLDKIFWTCASEGTACLNMYTAAAHAVRCYGYSRHKEHVNPNALGEARRPGLSCIRRNLLHNGNIRAEGGNAGFVLWKQGKRALVLKRCPLPNQKRLVTHTAGRTLVWRDVFCSFSYKRKKYRFELEYFATWKKPCSF